ncbi:MAG: hypothetical protein ACYDH6_23905 [Acidimicrobiales bacterium]
MTALFTALFIAGGVIVYVVFPHAVTESFGEEVTVRSEAVWFTSLGVAAALVGVRRGFRHLRQSALIARSGPDCNPWTGLEDDDRARLSAS